MAVNDVVARVWDGDVLVEEHVVTAETAEAKTVSVMIDGASTETYTIPVDPVVTEQAAATVRLEEAYDPSIAYDTRTIEDLEAQVAALTIQVNDLILLTLK